MWRRISELGTTGTDRDSAGGDATGSELGGEACLADPGFADDEGEASGTTGGFSPAPE
jgi:hypothetical protein